MYQKTLILTPKIQKNKLIVALTFIELKEEQFHKLICNLGVLKIESIRARNMNLNSLGLGTFLREDMATGEFGVPP